MAFYSVLELYSVVRSERKRVRFAKVDSAISSSGDPSMESHSPKRPHNAAIKHVAEFLAGNAYSVMVSLDQHIQTSESRNGHGFDSRVRAPKSAPGTPDLKHSHIGIPRNASFSSQDGRDWKNKQKNRGKVKYSSDSEAMSPTRSPTVDLLPLASKSRNDKFHKLFKHIPDDEHVLDYFSCALIGDILLQGVLYISDNWFCFYSNIFGHEKQLAIPITSVKSITKEKTAKFIPNAVGISTSKDKFVFGSLLSRDNTYRLMQLVLKKAQDAESSFKDDSDVDNLVHFKLNISESEALASSADSTRLINQESTDNLSSSSSSDPTISKQPSSIVPYSCRNYGTTPLINATHLESHKLFDYQRTYEMACWIILGVFRLPRATVLFIFASILLMFLLVSAIILTYRLVGVHKKLESIETWDDDKKDELRSQMYQDLHSLNHKVHRAAITRIHSELQANLQLLSQVKVTLKNLLLSYTGQQTPADYSKEDL